MEVILPRGAPRPDCRGGTQFALIASSYHGGAQRTQRRNGMATKRKTGTLKSATKTVGKAAKSVGKALGLAGKKGTKKKTTKKASPKKSTRKTTKAKSK
jgi:hypothetical protein